MTVAEKVKRIIADHLGCDIAEITDDTMIVDLFGSSGSDSLDLVEIVIALEEHLGVSPLEELGKPLTDLRVRDVIAAVERAAIAGAVAAKKKVPRAK
jgi:acyl carrier protein